MDSMLFIIAIFVSICISFGMVVIATTIRKLREEVNNLKDENRKLKDENTNLKDENHSLSCSEKSLLWQREQLRQEIVTMISDIGYYFGRRALMQDNFNKVKIFDKGMPLISYKKAWEVAVKMIYNWS